MTAIDVAEPLGRIIITWPAATGPVLPVWGITIADADTGRQITTVRKVVIADIDEDAIHADLTILCAPDGTPYLGDTRALRQQEDGTIREETFRFVVAEMRIAE